MHEVEYSIQRQNSVTGPKQTQFNWDVARTDKAFGKVPSVSGVSALLNFIVVKGLGLPISVLI